MCEKAQDDDSSEKKNILYKLLNTCLLDKQRVFCNEYSSNVDCDVIFESVQLGLKIIDLFSFKTKFVI